jgi:hypothetical protein
MTWQAYRLVYRLKSPLHIGWRKIGNLMQTRPYIPGRSWWGAATSRLTHHLGTYNYPEIGELVRDNLIFNYFYLATAVDNLFTPCWYVFNYEKKEDGQNKSDFDRRFIKSQASTAIDEQSNTSLEGQLYEVEYITPCIEGKDTHTPVFAVGYLFARKGDRIECTEQEVIVDGKALFAEVLQEMQLGGERRYGWGHLTLEQCTMCTEHNLFQHALDLSTTYPGITIEKDQPLLAHTAVHNVEAVGEIEPLVGREWKKDTGVGQQITCNGVYFAPGARLQVPSQVFTIGTYGLWSSLS